MGRIGSILADLAILSGASGLTYLGATSAYSYLTGIELTSVPIVHVCLVMFSLAIGATAAVTYNALKRKID